MPRHRRAAISNVPEELTRFPAINLLTGLISRRETVPLDQLDGAGMRWIRDNVRFGAWCALLALTIQLALSFGHVHLTPMARSDGGAPLVAAATHVAPGAPNDPTKAPAGPASDYCAICAVINLAATAMPAAAPALPVVLAFSQVRFRPQTEAALAASPHRLFSARAPPLA